MAEGESPEFELVPFRQIEELREELAKLKETPLPAPKKLELSLGEVSVKLDRLLAIFEEASHEIKVEEGGLPLTDQLKALGAKVEEVLNQNKEIAQALVTVADMISELQKQKKAPEPAPFLSNFPPVPGVKSPLPPLFPPSPGPSGIIPPPPLPPKKGLFR